MRGNEISMIFQEPMTSLNPAFTVGNQMAEAVRVHRQLSRGADAENAPLELLDLVGIADARRRLDDYPHAFSGGMRQRAMIAMALACEPEAPDRRRAHHRPRRHHPGPGARSPPAPAGASSAWRSSSSPMTSASSPRSPTA